LKKKIAVISTGNGGQSMAAYIALKGYPVTLYAREQERVDMFSNRIFKVKGIVNDTAEISLISCKMEEVIKDAYIILVTTPAQYHQAVAKQMAPHLKDKQTVILNPGRTFGTYEFEQVLKNNGCKAEILLGETDTFIFTCRCEKPGYPHIHEMKKKVKIAGHNKEDTAILVDMMNKLFHDIEPAKSTLHTGLSNMGIIFHPLPTLMNITRIEAKEIFRYYIDGISPLVANILEELDNERVKIAKKAGIEVLPVCEWLKEKYSSIGNNLYECIQNTHAYSNVLAPFEIDTRYIYEDVQTGCVPVCCLAKELGIKTRILDSVIDWASIVYKKDFMQTGRNSSKLDIRKILNDNLK